MAAPLDPLRAGDPIPTRRETWNAILAAARNSARVVNLAGVPDRDTRQPVPPNLTIQVRNDTGGDLARGSIVELSTPLISAVDYPFEVNARPFFIAIAPTGSGVVFGVLGDPIKDDGYGIAAILGAVVCEVSVGDEGHGYASPSAAVTARLTSGATGTCRIAWKESGTGNKQAIVLLQQVNAVAGGGGGSINTQNLDGTEIDATTTDMRTDSTTGVKVTQNLGGWAEVELIAASESQMGAVTIVDQIWKGQKKTDERWRTELASVGGDTLTSYIGAEPNSELTTALLLKLEDGSTSAETSVQGLADTTLASVGATCNNVDGFTVSSAFLWSDSATPFAAQLVLKSWDATGGALATGTIKVENATAYIEIISSSKLVLTGSAYSIRPSGTIIDGITHTFAVSGSDIQLPVTTGGIVTGTNTVTAPAGPVNSGGGTNLTGVVRGNGSTLSGAELSGAVTTSGSNVTTYTVVPPDKGGTGVANAVANTITFTGAFSLGMTLTAGTSVTLPTSGTLATTGDLSQFASTTSAQLAAVVSDETGSGALVFATSPSLVTPALGTPASGVLTNCTGYTDANLSTSDITTNNVSTAKHGFAPKLPNDAAKFFDGTGGYTIPTGTGNRVSTLSLTSKTAAFTADWGNAYTCTGASSYTVTLQANSGNAGKLIAIHCASATGTLTLDGNGSETVQGRTTMSLLLIDYIELISDGTNCWVAEIVYKDWVTSTSWTINAVTTNPTKGGTRVEEFDYRRDDRDIIVRGFYRQRSAGTAGSGLYKVPIPASLAADTGLVTVGTRASSTDLSNWGQGVGFGNLNAASAGIVYMSWLEPFLYDSTNLSFVGGYSSTANTASVIYQWGSSTFPLSSAEMEITFTARFPISGW